jgi:hypothetical protein
VRTRTPGEDCPRFDTQTRRAKLFNFEDHIVADPDRDRREAWADGDIFVGLSENADESGAKSRLPVDTRMKKGDRFLAKKLAVLLCMVSLVDSAGCRRIDGRLIRICVVSSGTPLERCLAERSPILETLPQARSRLDVVTSNSPSAWRRHDRLPEEQAITTPSVAPESCEIS